MWSKLKQAIRSREPRTVPSLHEATAEAFATINAGNCLGYFAGCKYTLHLK